MILSNKSISFIVTTIRSHDKSILSICFNTLV